METQRRLLVPRSVSEPQKEFESGTNQHDHRVLGIYVKFCQTWLLFVSSSLLAATICTETSF
eukprot:2395042-Amphidinium_carterae.1